LRRARTAGYFVRLFFVGTADPTINASRVARRVMHGGHDVPIPKIVSRYVRSIANCAEIAPDVDRFYLYDNSIEDADPQLVLRGADGVIEKRYMQAPPWTDPIVARLGEPPRAHR
jgi:predicted ABC-type ATPase